MSGQMPRVGQLWTYRYFHPYYRTVVVLDCYAQDVDAALASAQRFIRGQQRYADLNVPSHPDQMTLVESDNDNTALPLARLGAPFD